MNKDYSLFKKFAAFILDSHLDALVLAIITKAREENLTGLKYLSGVPEEQLFHETKRSVTEEVLTPLTEGNPFYKIEEGVSNWKSRSILLPKILISLSDITGVYHLWKQSLTGLLKVYDYSKEEGIALIQELEDYFFIAHL